MTEHFGTEPPDSGWLFTGNSRWVKNATRIAIVGGGPAGLFTAWLLNDAMPDAHLTIFEATGRLGGKIRTKRFRDGTPYESGVAELYEYLGPGGKDPLRLLIEEELGLKTVDISGGGVILREHVLCDMEDVSEAFGPMTRRQIERFHERCAELMPLDKYANRWQPDNKHPWADRTFLESMEAEITDPNARAYILAAIHSDLATEPHTCNGLNGIKNALMDNDKYMQVYHVKGGIGRIVGALEDGIEADVRREARVTAIEQAGSGYAVDFLHDGRDNRQEFDAVVVAMPNHWLSQIRWDDKLATAIRHVTAHYDLPAHYLRVSLRFKSPWWKSLDMPGEFWMWDGFNGCCIYDESTRWKSKKGHVLSLLIAGQDALLACSQNQSDRQIIQCVLDRLPAFMADAHREFVEGRVARYAGSLNAQPGGWPVHELRGEHQLAPGAYLVCDAFFDSTLNGCLISAATTMDLLCEHFGIDAEKEAESDVVAQLAPSEPL